MSYMKLRVSQHVYDRRLGRMAQLIGMKAPAIIIYNEARLIQEAYRPSLWNRMKWRFQTTRFGLWLTMLNYRLPPELEETIATDLADADFLLALDPSQLERFLRDVAKAPAIPYDTETDADSCSSCFPVHRAGILHADCDCACHH